MNLFFTNIKHKGVEAFTLLEVLASLVIVTLVILGPLTSAVNSSSYASQTKDVMISTYLAEESLELLHHQYDTLYIACANDKDACDSVSVPTLAGETPGGKAWRLFKTRLNDSTAGSKSCFDADGCSYDFLDMIDVTSVMPSPTKYLPTGAKCSTISLAYRMVDSKVRNYYVCGGAGHLAAAFNSNKTQYLRKVFIESKPTFPEVNPATPPANLGLYNDDLLVAATISFRRSNGMLRSIKVTDFLHTRS